MSNKSHKKDPKKSEKTVDEHNINSSREMSIVEGLRKINHDRYEGTMLMSENSVSNIPRRPSGILSLDLVVGGGYPYGRVIEIYGAEGSGKTTLTLHAIAEVQKLGGAGVFIDAEHALDPVYAKGLGVDIPRLIIDQPSCGEEALEMIDNISPMMKPGDLIVVDSVAALTPRDEINGEMGASHMGLHARLMSQAMRKLVGNMSKSGVIVIFVNQTRHKIGVVYGSPETTTGGDALKFYASIRIKTKKTGSVKKGNEVIGDGVKLQSVKNKTFPPFREAETTIRYGRGILRNIDVLTIAGLIGIVEKGNGGWLSYKGNVLGQGIDAVSETVGHEIIDELEVEILNRYGMKRNLN